MSKTQIVWDVKAIQVFSFGFQISVNILCCKHMTVYIRDQVKNVFLKNKIKKNQFSTTNCIKRVIGKGLLDLHSNMTLGFLKH